MQTFSTGSQSWGAHCGAGEDPAQGRREKGCCGPAHNGFVLGTEWVQQSWRDENLFTLNTTASGGKQNYLFGVNEGLFPISNLISSRVRKRDFFFVVFISYLFKRNNQLTDAVRSIPGRKCKYRRKIQELLVSPSLSIYRHTDLSCHSHFNLVWGTASINSECCRNVTNLQPWAALLCPYYLFASSVHWQSLPLRP